MKITIKKLPQSEVEIEGELDEGIFENYFTQALKNIGDKVEIDGFRKGKVPENILATKIPEIKILEEMAELALREHYPKIIESEKLDAVGHPEIFITKLARKNPLGFRIKTAILSAINLPKYKEIAKNILSKITDKDKDTTITDEELESTIADIRKSRAPKKHMSEATAETEEATTEPKEVDLPPFDDAFVQAIGPFKDVEDFKNKLRENMQLEKENSNKEKTRLKIIEEILEKSELEIPELLINLELNKILQRMESDITQMGLKFEDYLKHLNKTVDDLKKDFRTDAEKKAKLALVLNEIAKAEKIVADRHRNKCY
jgi:FKBP-type peptidyl-prolyl cis-trans isomerase (trigger factor)